MGSTLVLPLRTIGVSDTTAAVVTELLRGELEARGVAVLPAIQASPGTSATACDEADCAAALAADRGATSVVYGSLSQLGEKVVVRTRALRVGESTPWFLDQVSALYEEDLDTVTRRVADGIAAGRPNSEQATVETVRLDETLEPRRRATRSGVGVRAGFLFPVDGSYGGLDRLTSLRFNYKYETPTLLIDSTSLLGLAWAEGTLDWTILDIFAARIFGLGDLAPYLGVGVGVHSVQVELRRRVDTGYGYVYDDVYAEQSETTLSADLGIGLLALRTYDFMLVLDVRFHHVFSDFVEAGGNGASGIAVTFGTSR
jgi:hypothetical protein